MRQQRKKSGKRDTQPNDADQLMGQSIPNPQPQEEVQQIHVHYVHIQFSSQNPTNTDTHGHNTIHQLG